jgi:cytochrome c-type biogenesis protein CcmH
LPASFKIMTGGLGGTARLPQVSLFLVACFILAISAQPAFAVSDPSEMLPDARQEARAEYIGSQLRCLVCQNESIEDSNADLARDLRAIVRQHVVAGESNRQIMDWLVARYGEFVRLKPRLMASTVVLWATPFLALLAGGLAAWAGRRRVVPLPAPLSAMEEARVRELTGAP